MKKTVVSSWRERLMKRFGGWYPVVATFLAHQLSFATASLAAIAIQLNAEFASAQLINALLVTVILIILSNLLLLLWARAYTRHASEKIKAWAQQTKSTIHVDEKRAWQEINTFPWRYGAAALLNSFLIVIIPLMAYLYFSLDATTDQLIYTLIGGVIVSLGTAIIAVSVIEYMLMPAREILLPKDFEIQLSGITGFGLLGRTLSIIVALILISVLLVVPIGYHQTTTVLYEEIGSLEVFFQLQNQSIGFSIAALLLGSILAYALSRSVSSPIQQLISTFNKVEKGDLKQRAKVTSTDEVGELALYFNRMVARLEEFQGNLEAQVNQRTAQLKAVNEVGRAANAILDPNKLLERVVNLIADQFGYYYAAIFLIDTTGKRAELIQATGESGRILKENKHYLEIGGKSMVGAAISLRNARIALDVGEEPVRFDNPLLPETRSEIALPLIVGDRILGALDVQSTREAAFSEQDIETLQSMANQVAIALENARLFAETQQSLEEIRDVHRQYLLRSWSETVKEQGELAYSTNQAKPDKTEKPPITLDVPLVLRDQVIGRITLECDHELTTEERNLVEATAAQTSLALENARLLEESQQLALRERLVSEITRKIWGSATMDAILQTAIRELGRQLNVSEARIELSVEDSH